MLNTSSMPEQPLQACRIDCPLGTLVALRDHDNAIVYLDFEDPKGPTPPPGDALWRASPVAWDTSVFTPLTEQIGEYFAGTRAAFDLKLAARGNDFHKAVWEELRPIPYGVTISYGELARRLGRPGAARAVGRANGSNPISIIMPCHRVIGADGKLTGYSGGIERKAALLALERALTPLGQGTLPLGIESKGRGRKS